MCFLTDAIWGGSYHCQEGQWPPKYSKHATCEQRKRQENSNLPTQELVS